MIAGLIVDLLTQCLLFNSFFITSHHFVNTLLWQQRSPMKYATIDAHTYIELKLNELNWTEWKRGSEGEAERQGDVRVHWGVCYAEGLCRGGPELWMQRNDRQGLEGRWCHWKASWSREPCWHLNTAQLTRPASPAAVLLQRLLPPTHHQPPRPPSRDQRGLRWFVSRHCRDRWRNKTGWTTLSVKGYES